MDPINTFRQNCLALALDAAKTGPGTVDVDAVIADAKLMLDFVIGKDPQDDAVQF